MSERRYDRAEIIGGSITVLLGLIAAFISLGYPMGNIASIGPGVFPFALGVLLILLGAGIIGSAFGEAGDAPSMNFRAVGGVIAGIVAFALLVGTAGLVPAIIGCVIGARLSEPGLRLVPVVVLGLVLSAICWAIFVLGLGLPLAILKWPF